MPGSNDSIGMFGATSGLLRSSMVIFVNQGKPKTKANTAWHHAVYLAVIMMNRWDSEIQIKAALGAHPSLWFGEGLLN